MARTWDTVQEDSEGKIVTSTFSSDRERSHRAKQQRLTQSIRRGLIRYMVVLVDGSISSQEKDFRPSRFEVSKSAIEKFITEFYDQNPISQLSVAVTRDRVAEKLTELSGNPKNQINAVRQLVRTDGLASLQNSLLLAMAILRHIPDYGHRECLIVYSSYSTCDPGDIFDTIEAVKKLKIRVSVISLTSEIYICSHLAQVTHGSFSVARDSAHLTELILRHTSPPPELKHACPLTTNFIYMGFPRRILDSTPMFGHDGRAVRLMKISFMCPRCTTRTAAIPAQCGVCGLQLNSSSHIARSYHHLFPVQNFIEEDRVDTHRERDGDTSRHVTKMNSIASNSVSSAHQFSTSTCSGCLERFSADSLRLRCPCCEDVFCVECDLFIHDSLHNCPSCVSR